MLFVSLLQVGDEDQEDIEPEGGAPGRRPGGSSGRDAARLRRLPEHTAAAMASLPHQQQQHTATGHAEAQPITNSQVGYILLHNT